MRRLRWARPALLRFRALGSGLHDVEHILLRRSLRDLRGGGRSALLSEPELRSENRRLHWRRPGVQRRLLPKMRRSGSALLRRRERLRRRWLLLLGCVRGRRPDLWVDRVRGWRHLHEWALLWVRRARPK